MSFTSEFKEFVSKGNVVDLAVGVVIGAAFGKIVDSLVNDLLMPPIGLAIGGINFTDMKLILKDAVVDGTNIIPAVTLNYGNFIQVAINFLIVALAIFVFVVKPINRLRKKKEAPVVPPPSLSKEEQLLTEIRDLLKK